MNAGTFAVALIVDTTELELGIQSGFPPSQIKLDERKASWGCAFRWAGSIWSRPRSAGSFTFI